MLRWVLGSVPSDCSAMKLILFGRLQLIPLLTGDEEQCRPDQREADNLWQGYKLMIDYPVN